jgi:hypothetical protein
MDYKELDHPQQNLGQNMGVGFSASRGRKNEADKKDPKKSSYDKQYGDRNQSKAR